MAERTESQEPPEKQQPEKETETPQALRSEAEERTRTAQDVEKDIARDRNVTQHLPSLEIHDPKQESLLTKRQPAEQQSPGEPAKPGEAPKFGEAPKPGDSEWRPTAYATVQDFKLDGMAEHCHKLAQQAGLNDEQENAFRHTLMAAYLAQKYTALPTLVLGDTKELVTTGVDAAEQAWGLMKGAASSLRNWDSGPLNRALQRADREFGETVKDSSADVHNNHTGIAAAASGASLKVLQEAILDAARKVGKDGKMPPIRFRAEHLMA